MNRGAVPEAAVMLSVIVADATLNQAPSSNVVGPEAWFWGLSMNWPVREKLAMIVLPTRISSSREVDAEFVFVTVRRHALKTSATSFHVCALVKTGASSVTEVVWEMRPVPEVRSSFDPTTPAEVSKLSLAIFPLAQVLMQFM